MVWAKYVFDIASKDIFVEKNTQVNLFFKKLKKNLTFDIWNKRKLKTLCLYVCAQVKFEILLPSLCCHIVFYMYGICLTKWDYRVIRITLLSIITKVLSSVHAMLRGSWVMHH